MSTCASINDLMEKLEEKHERERALLQEEIKSMMKGAKKSKRRDLETKALQMEYDLRSQHMEEIEFLEENGFVERDENIEMGDAKLEKGPAINMEKEDAVVNDLNLDDKVAGISKKEKAKRKKERKVQKEREKLIEKEKLKETLSDLPSQREEELAQLNLILKKEGLQVKNVAADGHCLYRAIADQLNFANSTGCTLESELNFSDISYSNIRKVAADHMRKHVDTYAPFLALPGQCEEYDAYCNEVECVAQAKWGGQTEINAICESLGVPIWVYEVGRPVLKMGNENDNFVPLKITYHRHFYALGEHYNSVKPLNESDS